MTIYWKVRNNQNLHDLTNNNLLDDKSIEFGWCSDFAKDGLLESLNNKKSLQKEKYKLIFDVEYDYSRYPDLSLTYSFNSAVSEEGLVEIAKVYHQNIANAYVSEITFTGKEYITFIDFQNIPYKKGIKNLLVTLQKLSELEIASIISKIIIE